MPRQFPPVIASGSLSGSVQPTIPVGHAAMLRPWEARDASSVADAYNDPVILRWHSRRADSIHEASEWIDEWRNAWIAEAGCNWALTDLKDDAVLGRISLTELDLVDGVASLAYWVMRDARGRGLCTLAALAVSRWAFTEAGFHRIQLEHSTTNPQSCRVATKAGFRAEGIRRSSSLHADGWHDMHVHARINGDLSEPGEPLS